jgi:hypothetical protein
MEHIDGLKLKLAREALKTKPSYSKNNLEKIKAFLYKKTGEVFEDNIISEARRLVAMETYRKPHIDPVVLSTVMSINEMNAPEPVGIKIDTINEPGLYISIGCVHHPFVLKPLWNAFLRYINDHRNEIKGILIGGDFLDLNSLSNHDKGMIPIQGITLDYEYNSGNKALDDLDNAMGRNDYTKFYLFGNHEDRYFRTMRDVNHSKYGSSLLSPVAALKLRERGFNVLTDWKNDSIKIGPYLEVVHGEYINQHPAKKHIDAYRKSVLFYHTHRISSYLEGQVAGYNGGWMGDKNSPAFGYAPRGMRSSWNNGFNLIHLDENMYFHIQQIIWYNNRFYINNKIYK